MWTAPPCGVERDCRDEATTQERVHLLYIFSSSLLFFLFLKDNYLYVSGSDVPPCPGSGVRGHGCRSSDYGPLGWGTASELRPHLGLRLAAHHISVYSTYGNRGELHRYTHVGLGRGTGPVCLLD